MELKCKTCAWFIDESFGEGLCVRFPPVPVYVPETEFAPGTKESAWSTVSEGEFCGEWKANPKMQKAPPSPSEMVKEMKDKGELPGW